MPLKIKLHAVPHLKGLIYGKDKSGRKSTAVLLLKARLKNWGCYALSKRIQSSEQAQPTFAKMPKSAGIEGGPFKIKKIFFGPKLFFWGREHFLYLVPAQNFEF